MALDIVDIAISEISYSGGSKELKSVQKLEIKGDNPKAPVLTMTRDRQPIGYTAGIPMYTGTLTVAQLKPPEVPWFNLMQTNEKFLFTYEEGDGGQRFSCQDMVVNTVSKPFQENGQTVFTVDVAFLRHRPEA